MVYTVKAESYAHGPALCTWSAGLLEDFILRKCATCLHTIITIAKSLMRSKCIGINQLYLCSATSPSLLKAWLFDPSS